LGPGWESDGYCGLVKGGGNAVHGDWVVGVRAT
jgi:hypothetical protein